MHNQKQNFINRDEIRVFPSFQKTKKQKIYISIFFILFLKRMHFIIRVWHELNLEKKIYLRLDREIILISLFWHSSTYTYIIIILKRNKHFLTIYQETKFPTIIKKFITQLKFFQTFQGNNFISFTRNLINLKLLIYLFIDIILVIVPFVICIYFSRGSGTYLIFRRSVSRTYVN